MLWVYGAPRRVNDRGVTHYEGVDMESVDQGAREARYAEAMRDLNYPTGPFVDSISEHAVETITRAVLPLVDAEVAAAVSEAQAERDNTRALLRSEFRHSSGLAGKVDELAAEVERLREGIQALADAPPGDCEGAACIWPDDLRTLLSPSPAATAGEAVQS